MDDISAGSGILVDILNVDDASTSDGPPLPTTTFAMPESTSPAMDATFHDVARGGGVRKLSYRESS